MNIVTLNTTQVIAATTDFAAIEKLTAPLRELTPIECSFIGGGDNVVNFQ
jgi:hypothetical protein